MANKRIIEFEEETSPDNADLLVLGKSGGLGTRKLTISRLLAGVRQSISDINNSLSNVQTEITSHSNTLNSLSTSISALQDSIANKVDKVSGKGLSENDFTSTLLTKLNNLTTSTATTSANGYMSSSDKTKLNNIATAANRVTFSHETKTAYLSAAVASGAVATWSVNIASSTSGHSYTFLSVDEVCILGDYWDKVHYMQWERSGNTLTVRGRASGAIAQNAICQVKVSYYEAT